MVKVHFLKNAWFSNFNIVFPGSCSYCAIFYISFCLFCEDFASILFSYAVSIMVIKVPKLIPPVLFVQNCILMLMFSHTFNSFLNELSF